MLITLGKACLNKLKAERGLLTTVHSSADGNHILFDNIHATCRCHYTLIIPLSAVTYSFPSTPPTSELQEWIFEEILNFCFLNRELKGEISQNIKYKIAKQQSQRQTGARTCTRLPPPKGVLSKVDNYIYHLCFISQLDNLSG